LRHRPNRRVRCKAKVLRTRILKQACRARGQEEILGNVTVSGVAPPKPTVAMKSKVGDDASVREWTGGDTDQFKSERILGDVESDSGPVSARSIFDDVDM
jgi:hypothetical protein